jgi:4-hydroxy-3-methylbut-2-enyl diphosphate reductase
LQVLLATPRGFCAGVVRAIDAVEEALTRYGPPVYVRRPIVHNMAVVSALEAKGAIFVEDLDEVPVGGVVIMSAHGIAPAVMKDAHRRGLRPFDAVCPLVAKVHREVVRHHRDGRHVILVGHDGHPEVIGTLGHVPFGAASVVSSAEQVSSLKFPNNMPVAYAIQTTYSVDDAREIVDAILARFPDAAGPSGSDICYATTNRQAAIRELSRRAGAVLVAGERFSSNASRLAEVARSSGCSSVQLVSSASDIDWAPLSTIRTLAVTSAASTPETTVDEIMFELRRRFDVRLEENRGRIETTAFKPVRLP